MICCSCAGAVEPANAMYLQHAEAAQQWHQATNGVHHPGDAGYMNGHSGWAPHQNGGMNGGSNRVVWHDSQAIQLPPPGGWDASNHPLSKAVPQTCTIMFFPGTAHALLCFVLVHGSTTIQGRPTCCLVGSPLARNIGLVDGMACGGIFWHSYYSLCFTEYASPEAHVCECRSSGAVG